MQWNFKASSQNICRYSLLLYAGSADDAVQSKCSSVFTQWLYYCSDAVFIQVPFVSGSSSTTEKQFRVYFELTNETSRQVHKTSVDIVCSYIQNLLMTQFRCLRVSGALHVMCVEETIRVMWKWFERFFKRFNNTNLRLFRKYILVNFSQSNINPRNIKRKASMLQID